MSDIIKLHGLTFTTTDEPRIRDIDLAAKLEYARPRKIRELIERECASGILKNSDVRPVAGRTPRGGGVAGVVTEYWLNERAALYIASRSDTARGRELHMALVDMFIEVRRRAEVGNKGAQLLYLIAHKPNPYEELWPNEAVADICKCCRIAYDGIHFPQAMFSICEEVYKLILPDTLYRAMRERNPRPILDDGSRGDRRHNHHQFFEPELRRVMSEQMDVIRLLAGQSRSKDDFVARLRRQYRGEMLQTAF